MRHSTDHELGSPLADSGDDPPVQGLTEGHSGRSGPAAVDGRALTFRAGLPASLQLAELALSGQERTVARRPLRTETGDRSAAQTVPAAARTQSPVEANDNATASPPGSGGFRPLLREILLLALLAATLTAVYNLGRLHAYQNVIILPDPDRSNHAIT